MTSNANNRMIRESGLDDVVLKHIQTAPNRRILSGMRPFRVDADGTPREMVDLLKRLDSAEARSAGRQAANRDSHA